MEQAKSNNSLAIFKLIFFSIFGIIMFFVPVNLFGTNTILLDHIVNLIKNNLPTLSNLYALIIIAIGGVLPFVKKTYKKDKVTFTFSVLKFLGIFVAIMAVFNIGPKSLMTPNMIPFLYNKLVIPVGLVVPIGAIFLSFLIGYGLLEFIGVLMQPIMKPVFKTPGKSAVDAVASFAGSYSLALLITNSVYKEGKYNTKEAYIIATGFSTVSASFMMVVAKTLGLMDMWNIYFWSTLVITFATTIIVIRFKPISKISESYYNNVSNEEIEITSNRFKNALEQGIEVSKNSPSLISCIKSNILDGLMMSTSILPTILSVGLIGLFLAEFTPIFDVLGYILFPFTYILGFFGLDDPVLVSKALTLSLAEMFLPATFVGESLNLITRYVIGVVSIGSILFFSGSIPCLLSTDIDFKIKDLVIIWFQRVIVSMFLSFIFGMFFIV